jgi:predicted exporter
MNIEKIKTILMAILGACNVVVEIIIPIFVMLLFIKVYGLTGASINILTWVGLLATLFRGIKYIIFK